MGWQPPVKAGRGIIGNGYALPWCTRKLLLMFANDSRFSVCRGKAAIIVS
jgi:hypothetical protein